MNELKAESLNAYRWTVKEFMPIGDPCTVEC